MKNGKQLKKAGIAVYCVFALAIAIVVLWHHNPLADQGEEIIKKVISCLVIAVSCLLFGLFYDKITILPKELFQNRRLIWKLAKNDFKKRYAGSYLGIIWAMVQPVITIVMYWLVFEKLFPGSRPVVKNGTEIPFVLFLTAGLVPWFYFNEAWTNGTMALLEYNYLVKKVVFKISILPIIKIVAASFIHVFFACILLVIASFYGHYPSLYTLQLLYFSFCLFIFVLALSYTTCALMVFIRDISQIINIILQIGIWATPIMWNIEDIHEKWVTILKLNPLVYIVNGYRNAVYGQGWFWEDFYSTMYFWLVTVVLFGMGAVVFKRLKVHFADVM